MAVRTTRTLNPLPFQDLEPHRFEDLVRQIAYEFRDWQALEAIGRSGSDGGVDIRGLETVKTPTLPPDDDENDEGATTAARVWIFQCKREKAMGPKKVRATVEESLPKAGANNVHGFVLAAGCNLSKKARDAFREEMVVRGVQEFFVWSRSELEDMLFQPQHDRLLFAYFGISLAPRRRSLATHIRREVELKKQLLRLFDNDDRPESAFLLRDPTDDRYPENSPDRRWKLCSFNHVRSPGLLAFVAAERLAWVSAAQDAWDRIPSYNHLPRSLLYLLRQENAWGLDQPRDQTSQHVCDFWHEYVDESQRALLRIIHFVRVADVVAIDPIGDGYFPVPHVHILYQQGGIPFTHRRAVLRRPTGMRQGIALDPERSPRVTFFPDPLPDSLSVPKGFGLAIPKQINKASSGILQRVADLGAKEARTNESSTPTTVSDEVVNAEFRAWRDRVVLPVFGAVAHELRERGHRVWVRQLEAHDAWRGAEVIELRCDVRGSGGQVRYELIRDKAVKTEIRPFGRSFERDDEPKAMASMTSETVEADIARMFDRLES